MSKRSRQIIMMFLFTYAHAEPSQLFFYVNRFTHVTNKWESWWVVASETLESLVFGNPCEVWVYCPLQLAFFLISEEIQKSLGLCTHT
jgi:hypothetical protein